MSNKDNTTMTHSTKNILIAALIICLAAPLCAAYQGKATLTVLSVESQAGSAAPAVSFKPIQRQASFTPPSFSISPRIRPSLGDSAFTASLISLAALNVADYFSTRQALKLPGLSEGNPLMAPFVKNELLFTGVKLGVTALEYFLVRKIYKNNKVLGWVISAAANVAMGYIVSNNIRLIDQARAHI
jgi:hypothetical protein